MTNVIRFTSNFNNKLNCHYFTTIRHFNKHRAGDTVLVEFGGKVRVCFVMEVRVLPISKLSDWQCYIDGGMNRQCMLLTLKKLIGINVDNMSYKLYMYLLEARTQWLDLSEVDSPLL